MALVVERSIWREINMELNNENVQSFPIDFTDENTFITKSGDTPESVIDRFPDIDSKGKTVVITDPYLFQQQDDDYKKLLIKALKRLNATKIIYCNQQHPNRILFTEIRSSLCNCSLDYKKLERCHDRFWYCVETRRGFSTGTSLNGIGKKICSVDMLSDESNADFYQMLIDEGVIISESK